MPSQSTEDYLKHIFLIQSAEKRASTSALAEKLNVSPASVSEMVSKLSKYGCIANTPYHGFKLTKRGEKIALNLVRKHRLIEVFLQQHLNYRWDEVHNEAEKLEHVCSDLFIDKLDEYLGFPKLDPHGDPIPDKNGRTSKLPYIRLSSCTANERYIVSKVNDISQDILKYLSKIGIRLNTEIKIEEKIEFDGSVLISFNNFEQLLSKKISDNIYVTKVKMN